MSGETEFKNIIYFCPPGTGKTWMLRQLKEKFEPSTKLAKDDLDLSTVVKNLSWWECIALALADFNKESRVSEINEHPVIQAKMRIQSSKTVTQTIWGQLQNHTNTDSDNVNTRLRQTS